MRCPDASHAVGALDLRIDDEVFLVVLHPLREIVADIDG